MADYVGNELTDHTNRLNMDGETVRIGRVKPHFKSRNLAVFLCHLFNAVSFRLRANTTGQFLIAGRWTKSTVVALFFGAEQKAICLHLGQRLAKLKQLVTPMGARRTALTSYPAWLNLECLTESAMRNGK